jgi:hypothetical protein
MATTRIEQLNSTQKQYISCNINKTANFLHKFKAIFALFVYQNHGFNP